MVKNGIEVTSYPGVSKKLKLVINATTHEDIDEDWNS